MECYGKQIWTNLTKGILHKLGIGLPDEAKYKAVKARWDAIAKPLDGMGRFEEITAQIGAVTGDEALDLSRKAVLIFCADNGIVAEGVSQFRRVLFRSRAGSDVCGRTVDGKEKFFRRTDGVMHRCRHDSG